VTSGEFEGSTYVEWTGNFSSDADAGMFLFYPLFEPRLLSSGGYVNLNLNKMLIIFIPGVIQDGKFKRRDALADLAKAAKKM